MIEFLQRVYYYTYTRVLVVVVVYILQCAHLSSPALDIRVVVNYGESNIVLCIGECAHAYNISYT